MLYCLKCKVEHNMDKAPDEGVCLECNGPLVEDPEEADAVRNALHDFLFEYQEKRAVQRATGKVTGGKN